MPHEADRMTRGLASSIRVRARARQSRRRRPSGWHRCGHRRAWRTPLRAPSHVDQHAVALDDPEPGQHAGKARDLVAQLPIGEPHDLPGHRDVPDQRNLVAASGRDVSIDRVPAGVEPAIREPVIERRVGVVEHAVPPLLPVDRFGGLGPELLRTIDRAAIGLGIAPRHWLTPCGYAGFSANSTQLAKPLEAPPACGRRP